MDEKPIWELNVMFQSLRLPEASVDEARTPRLKLRFMASMVFILSNIRGYSDQMLFGKRFVKESRKYRHENNYC